MMKEGHHTFRAEISKIEYRKIRRNINENKS